MITYLLCVALGAALAEIVYSFRKNPTNVFTSRYTRMSKDALSDLRKEYELEMTFWVNILEKNIFYITIHEERQGQAFAQKSLFLKLKTFAVQRIDAIRNILDEMDKASE